MRGHFFMALVLVLAWSSSYGEEFGFDSMDFPGSESTSSGSFDNEPSFEIEFVDPVPQAPVEYATPQATSSQPFCVKDAASIANQPSMQPVADIYGSRWAGRGVYHGTLGSYDSKLTIQIKENGTYEAKGCAEIPLLGTQCRVMDRGTVRICEQNGVITMSGESLMGKAPLHNRYNPNDPTFLVDAGSDHSAFLMKRVQ